MGKSLEKGVLTVFRSGLVSEVVANNTHIHLHLCRDRFSTFWRSSICLSQPQQSLMEESVAYGLDTAARDSAVRRGLRTPVRAVRAGNTRLDQMRIVTETTTALATRHRRAITRRERARSRAARGGTTQALAQRPVGHARRVRQANTTQTPARRAARTAFRVTQANTTHTPARRPARTAWIVRQANTTQTVVSRAANRAVQDGTIQALAQRPVGHARRVLQANTTHTPAKTALRIAWSVRQAHTTQRPVRTALRTAWIVR